MTLRIMTSNTRGRSRRGALKSTPPAPLHGCSRPGPFRPLLPIQQSPLAREFADVCAVLYYFHRAAEPPLRVADGEVADEDELALELDPEFADVALALLECGEYRPNHVKALRRVAVFDVPPDYVWTAREDALIPL
jgi:hypothetical protein